MKLYYSATSPYVRKVMIVAIETGQLSELECVTTAVVPVSSAGSNTIDLAPANPLAKVPTLETNDGLTLFDSRVICEYLDAQHTGERLFPDSGRQRWLALRDQALGDGILDASLLVRFEMALRPDTLRWPDWISGQQGKAERGLDLLEANAEEFADRFDIGTITIACALGYRDFRFADSPWRATRPKLAHWFEQISKRSSLRETVVPDTAA